MTKVKICGLSTPSAVRVAVEKGADYIGFVFAKSRRQVTIEQANELASLIPKNVQKVGVFVNDSLENILQAIKNVPLDVVQLHGGETVKFVRKIPVPVIKAIPVNEHFSENILKFPETMLLFDAPIAGSGKMFDWESLNPQAIKQPFFIAGGLNPENVRQAIETFQPYGVDVSSGVETDGTKDEGKIIRFLEEVQHA